MPKGIEIIDAKFFNQLENGEDFTLNTSNYSTVLTGNILGRYKAVHQVAVSWWAKTPGVQNQEWTFRAADDSITRINGTWAEDGFIVGDTIDLATTGGTNNVTGVIQSISSDGYTIYLNVALTDQVDQYAIGVGSRTNNDIEFRYGLIENQEVTNFKSKVDGSEQRYTLKGITGTLQTMTESGVVKSWRNGQVQARTITSTTRERVNGSVTKTHNLQTYEIEHEFIILPAYLEGQTDNVNDLIQPTLFENFNTLKYVFEINQAEALNDSADRHGGKWQGNSGNTGWLNENFNNEETIFSVTSVSYKNVSDNAFVNGLQTSSATRVTVRLATTNVFNSSTLFSLVHQALLPESSYKGTTAKANDFEYNNIYESFYGQFDAASSSGTLIENVTMVTNTGTTATLTFDINYSAAQTDLISTDDSFLLAILIQSNGVSVANSDQTMLKIDSQSYVKTQYGDDTAGMITFGAIEFFDHQLDPSVDTGFTSIGSYNEDKMLSRFNFTMVNDSSAGIDAYLNKVTCRLVAINNSSYKILSELHKTVYDLTPYPMVPGSPTTKQDINLSTSRNFKLNSSDPFNDVSISFVGYSGDNKEYTFDWSFAINWEDYRLNTSTDTDFYDASELNNGLNFDTANYSQNTAVPKSSVVTLYDFEVLNLEDDTTTTYRQVSPPIPVYDYTETDESPNPFTVVKKLTNQAGTDTSLSILDSENTKVFFEFTDSRGDVGTDYQGVIKLEEYQNGGLQNIYEISTFRTPLANSPLVPLSGDTYARITKSPFNVLTLECEIDKDKVQTGKQYHISGRIWLVPNLSYLFEDGTNFLFEDGTDYEFEN